MEIRAGAEAPELRPPHRVSRRGTEHSFFYYTIRADLLREKKCTKPSRDFPGKRAAAQNARLFAETFTKFFHNFHTALWKTQKINFFAQKKETVT